MLNRPLARRAVQSLGLVLRRTAAHVRENGNDRRGERCGGSFRSQKGPQASRADSGCRGESWPTSASSNLVRRRLPSKIRKDGKAAPTAFRCDHRAFLQWSVPGSNR
jgi:hypothetical protein